MSFANHFTASAPSSAFGYTRGTPYFQGSGGGTGGTMAGAGQFAAGQGPASAGVGGWHPTILYMIGLVFAEMIVFAFLGRHLA